MSRRGLDQERTAVHCDLFNVLPMLMHGAQPPSLVSDKTNTWRGALGLHCVLFFPDSPPPAISGPDLLDLGPDRSHLPRKHLLVRSSTWWQRLHFLNPRPRSLPHHVPLPQTPSSRQSPCLWCDVCLIQSLAADPYRLLGTGQQQLPVPTQWHLRRLASSRQERPSHSRPRG